MHGDDELGHEQPAGQGRLGRVHDVVAADGQHHQLRLIKLPDELHVLEHRGVAGVIGHKAVGEFNHKTARVSRGHHAALVFGGGRVHRLGHGDFQAIGLEGAAFVHAHHLGHSLLGQDDRKLMDHHHLGPGLLGDFHSVAHVVGVPVGDQNEIYLPHLAHRRRKHRVGEPGVDKHRLAGPA